MAKDRTVRRRVLLVAASALVVIGAAAPSGCQPATKPLSTIYGKATHSSVPAPLSDPPCPLEEAWGIPIQGIREKWGFRIAAADPNEWLSLRPCLTFGSGALTTIHDTPFTIYTESGDVTGTASGVRESLGFDVDMYSVALTITSGTKAYRDASGTIYLAGCQRGGRFVSSEIRRDRPADSMAYCARFIES